jgi:hypothetical protein
MAQYIDKSALVAEIERRIKERDFQMKSGCWISSTYMYEDLLDFINTLEVKDANEALRTEYEKGRADVIADTLSWLENCWPRYCSNQTIIDGFKEAIKGE